MVMKKKSKGKVTHDIFKGIRKPMPPPTKVMEDKKRYNRRDKIWREDAENT